MRTILKHGAVIDHVTPDEMRAMLGDSSDKESASKRVRTAVGVNLDAAGNGQDEVYGVPIGFEFEARRLFVNLSTASGPVTGSVALNVAGKQIALLRSGVLMEYAVPLAPTALAQVPGMQTWGFQEGPYLRNGEVFEVQAVGLTALATLMVTLEGILTRPAR